MFAAGWIRAMQRGDHHAAWAISDAVLAAGIRPDDPALPYHQRLVWTGQPVAGRAVLVRCYHGLGDTLQFARYLAPLRARAAHVTLEAQPELVPLLTGLTGVDRLEPFDPASPLPPAECDLEIMELPHALRLEPQHAPRPPYLPPVVPQPGGGIGLCWQAGAWDPRRSIPPSLMLPHFAGQRCTALQPGLPPPGLAPCPPTIAATAALIAGLDQVVTVDTMVAHLAGALARPVTLLLHHDADWRWMRERSDTPWYPTMRLRRQPAPGDWAAMLERDRLSLNRRNGAITL